MTDISLDLRKERLALSQRRLGIAVPLFLGVTAAYGAAVLAVLAAPLWASLLLVPACGMLEVMLFVIAHDACHQSYTPSPVLNRIIGRLAFLPALHAYSLWDHEHNQVHHRFNNIRELDYTWAPMSPQEFSAAPRLRRIIYKFYRSPAGVPFYYLFEIWLKRLIFPRHATLGTIHTIHIVDSALLALHTALYIYVLCVLGSWFGKSPLEAATLALVVPFLVFSGLISTAIFLHHTHFAVPWYASLEEWRKGLGSIYGTVHVEFPRMARWLTLNIMEHNAHHYAPGVPLYRLGEMQSVVDTPNVVAWQFSVRGYGHICRRCKLFDYETSRWLDFSGRPAGKSLRR